MSDLSVHLKVVDNTVNQKMNDRQNIMETGFCTSTSTARRVCQQATINNITVKYICIISVNKPWRQSQKKTKKRE